MTQTHNYYSFKSGYTPTYSEAEERKFRLPRRIHPLAAFQIELNQENRAQQEAETRLAAMRQDLQAFPQSHWLQDQRFVDALKGLEVNVIVRQIPGCRGFVGPCQVPVSLKNSTVVNWELDIPRPVFIQHRPDRKKRVSGTQYVVNPTDIPSLNETFSNSDGSGTQGVRGLYLVIRGSHTAKLVRRVIHIEDPGLYIFPRMKAQAVELVCKGKKVVGEVHVPEPVLTVHRDDVLVVEETQAFHEQGNKGMAAMRKVAEDELEEKKKAEKQRVAAQGLP